MCNIMFFYERLRAYSSYAIALAQGRFAGPVGKWVLGKRVGTIAPLISDFKFFCSGFRVPTSRE